MEPFKGSKKVARADVRTLGKKEIKVYDEFFKENYEPATFWRVGMLLYEHKGESMSIHETVRRILPPQQRRVDLLFANPDGVFIVEFKENITPSAIGQLLIYHDIMCRRFRSVPRTGMILAGSSCDSDVYGYCEKIGIDVQTFKV